MANLCICNILLGNNEAAESLLRTIDRYEQTEGTSENGSRNHSCIANTLIGALYCSKGSIEFGVSRVIKGMEPVQEKLNRETWFYAKKFFISLLEMLSKQMFLLEDSTFTGTLSLLEKCEKYGETLNCFYDPIMKSKRTVAQEAARIRQFYVSLYAVCK